MKGSSRDDTRIEGPALRAVTALMIRRDQTIEDLLDTTGSTSEELEEILDGLSKQELVQQTVTGRYRMTASGLGVFYRTLGEIRDALATRQPAATLPFTVETTWREFLCLNYLVDPDALERVIPRVFDLVLKDGRALMSVTVASLEAMRPRGLPALVGSHFCHLTLRAVVSFENCEGEKRLGYDFTASMTNSELFSRIGNSVTEFKFHEFRTGSITFLKQGSRLVLGAEAPGAALDLVASVDLSEARADPPPSSVFSSREELDTLILDHADAFGYLPGKNFVYVLRIEREPWRYTFVEPSSLYLAYVEEQGPLGPGAASLDSVLHGRGVRYRWQPLIRETLDDAVVRRIS